MNWLSVVKLHHLVETSSYRWLYLTEQQIDERRCIIIQNWIRIYFPDAFYYSLEFVIPLVLSFARGCDDEQNPEIRHCLHIVRRTPPSDMEDNLERLIALRVDLEEELLQRVDTPFMVGVESITHKRFVLCDYNRDGDSYRSPWCNQYFPPIEDDELGDGLKPSALLRKFEIEANQVFDIYRQMYFESGVSSVYCWETDVIGSFAACFCIWKSVSKDGAIHGGSLGFQKIVLCDGSWSSTHVFEVKSLKQRDHWKYTLTSTVFVILPKPTSVDLSGFIVKQTVKSTKLDVDRGQSHLEIMGPMIEDLELEITRDLEGILFRNIPEVINGMRKY
eukprot:165013_1